MNVPNNVLPMGLDAVMQYGGKDNRIEFEMTVDLNQMVGEDIDYLNDLADRVALQGDLLGIGLSDLNYRVSGHVTGRGPWSGSVVLTVNGSVKDILDEMEDR